MRRESEEASTEQGQKLNRLPLQHQQHQQQTFRIKGINGVTIAHFRGQCYCSSWAHTLDEIFRVWREVKSLLDVPEEMWDPSWHVRNLDQVARLHAKNPVTTHNRIISSHFGVQRWSWSEGTYKNRIERKLVHTQLRCSPTDNTHPTLKPWSRGDAWLRSGRLIRTMMNKGADNLNIKVELACALYQS